MARAGGPWGGDDTHVLGAWANVTPQGRSVTPVAKTT